MPSDEHDVERASLAEKSCKDCSVTEPPLYWHSENLAFYCSDCVLIRDEQVKPLTPEQWQELLARNPYTDENNEN